MQKKENTEVAPAKKTHLQWVVVFSLISAIIITSFVSWLLYNHTVDLLTQNLKKQELSIVRTAALQFDSKDLDQLKKESDYKKPEWEKVVKQLAKIRANNEEIVFAYILRKTETDDKKMEFVADADSLDPYAKIDLNKDGVIDDADALVAPGNLYEDLPEEAFQGYTTPTTNKDLYNDQWGLLISGYAPILDQNGKTNAIIAIDIRANDFNAITRETFFPFLAFILVLISILLILTTILIRTWNKRIELFAELDRQKDELLSIVSHQLATPVSSIRWNLEMMLDGDMGKLSKTLEENIKSLQDISGNLSDLVSMILDVSRIQLGRMRVEKQELDLETFFKEILEIIEPKAKEKKVNFIKSIPSKFPVAMLDKRYTHMTIENLLSNAIKYTPEKGEVSFKIEIRDNNLYCEVKDSGIGIPESEQDKIFGKLFRASNARNQFEGNGFGLYVAKGAVEAQGGKIWFSSQEKKGTTFFLELPLN